MFDYNFQLDMTQWVMIISILLVATVVIILSKKYKWGAKPKFNNESRNDNEVENSRIVNNESINKSKQCHYCKKTIDKNASVCPFCRKEQPNIAVTIVTLIIIIIILIPIGKCFMDINNDVKASKQSSKIESIEDTISSVKYYANDIIKKYAKDPGSVEVIEYTNFQNLGNYKYTINVMWRGKNSFGAYNVQTTTVLYELDKKGKIHYKIISGD